MQFSDKYENVFKKIHWNDDYLILGLEDKYVGNYNINATHIYSAAMHVGMVDMNTF